MFRGVRNRQAHIPLPEIRNVHPFYSKHPYHIWYLVKSKNKMQASTPRQHFKEMEMTKFCLLVIFKCYFMILFFCIFWFKEKRSTQMNSHISKRSIISLCCFLSFLCCLFLSNCHTGEISNIKSTVRSDIKVPHHHRGFAIMANFTVLWTPAAWVSLLPTSTSLRELASCLLSETTEKILKERSFFLSIRVVSD